MRKCVHFLFFLESVNYVKKSVYLVECPYFLVVSEKVDTFYERSGNLVYIVRKFVNFTGKFVHFF